MFIYATLSGSGEGDAARKVLERIAGKALPSITSSLVLDEVIWTVWKKTSRPHALDAADRLYRLPGLDIVGVSPQVPQRAIALMRERPLKPRDAFHVATMAEHEAQTIVSTDPDFDHVPGIRRLEPAAAARRK